jgi:predicted XRE-type DNA-binding protein
MAPQKNKTRETVLGTIGSGNIFADLGLPDAETRLLKAKLASKIDDAIIGRRLSDVAAGAMIGLSGRKVSDLRNGRTKDYSVERLYELLNSFGGER